MERPYIERGLGAIGGLGEDARAVRPYFLKKIITRPLNFCAPSGTRTRTTAMVKGF